MAAWDIGGYCHICDGVMFDVATGCKKCERYTCTECLNEKGVCLDCVEHEK